MTKEEATDHAMTDDQERLAALWALAVEDDADAQAPQAPQPQGPSELRGGDPLSRLLVGFLVVGIALGLAVGGAFLMRLVRAPKRPTSVTPHETKISADGVHNLSIDWRLGKARVIGADDDEPAIVVSEEFADAESAEYPATVQVADGTLSLSYGLPLGLATESGQGTSLTIRLPREVASELETVTCTMSNGTIEMRDLGCDALEITVGSGFADVRNVRGEVLTLQIESGMAQVEGQFSRQIDAAATSGSLHVASSVMPASATLKVTSGDAVLALPGKADFEARVKKASGSFELAFDARREGDAYLVGSGGNSVTVDVGSGSARIERYAQLRW